MMTALAPSGAGSNGRRCALPMKHTAVVPVLVALVFAASACTAYKVRDTDPNAGGGSSMYRSAAGAH